MKPLTRQPRERMPLAYTLDSLAEMTGVGRTTLNKHIKEGHLPAKKIGRHIIVLRKDVETWLGDLSEYKPESAEHTGGMRPLADYLTRDYWEAGGYRPNDYRSHRNHSLCGCRPEN